MSRNIFFYKNLSLKDSFETRVFLMFFHYSIILIILKKKKYKSDQENYNNLFYCIENNLRELGLGDISVNKKMKDLNKIFYDILIKVNIDKINFKLNNDLIVKYFSNLKENEQKLRKCALYFENFYNFCFETSPDSMLEHFQNYKF